MSNSTPIGSAQHALAALSRWGSSADVDKLAPRDVKAGARFQVLNTVAETGKTNGTKATCAGGDIHKIAKAKRLAKARAVHQAVVKKEASKVRGSIKSGRKIQSRPFQKKEKANV